MNLFKSVKKEILLGSLLLISASCASADNILNLGEGVNLIASNGKEVNTDSFFNNSTTYNLPNGVNQILVNYTAEIKKGSEYEIEHTNAFVLLFESNDAELTISAPIIKKLSDISSFEKSKSWTLVSKSGNRLAFKAAIIEKKGFQLSRDYERELEEFNQTGSIAALPKAPLFSTSQLNSKKHATDNNNNSKAQENMPAKMLIFWYNQADLETRNSFKKLINNQ